jgi:sulfite reductase (ferredoxin)
MYQLPDTLTEDIQHFGHLIDDFSEGKISNVQFKANRVPMGIYEQRKDGSYMVRIRCTGGFITPAQLRQVALTAQNHQSSLLHITSRQEIQIHHVRIEQTKTILPELQDVSLSSKGGGGNTVRNILVDITSGIDLEETFDTLPHAVALTTRLIAESDSFTLPRKLKIAFSNRENELGFTAVNDLGLVAKIQNGERGFQVFLGGSVASNPTIGWEIFDFLPERDLFNVAIAAKRFFNNHGNRKNKHKARIRYIFYKEGEEKAKALFFDYYNALKTNEDSPYHFEPLFFEQATPWFDPLEEHSEAFDQWVKRYVTNQRQEGLNAVILPFENGNTKSEALLKIAQFAGSFGEDVLRFTPGQQLQLRNIPSAYLSNVYRMARVLGLQTERFAIANKVVSCTGADTCRLGICLSKGAGSALREKLAASSLDLDRLGHFQIHLSGCPNSCAQQIWADLGFSGKVGRNERMYPAYNVWVGAVQNSPPRLGENLGTISAKDLPEFTEQILADYLSEKEDFLSFRDYLDEGGKEAILLRLRAYEEIPAFSQDKNYYYDWGSEDVFSVANRGQAECSAGLFDMIDLDLNFIREGFLQLETEERPDKTDQILYNILFSSARMLLITKGAEPRTTGETFDLFLEKFIREGLVSEAYTELVRTAKEQSDYLFRTQKEQIMALAKAVIALYETMDDSLQFKNQMVKTPVTTTAADGKIHTKDLRGVSCPMNFVQTKIKLSTISSGEKLEVWLDDGAPIQNVPGSVQNEGHEILSVTQVNDYWSVLIRKV